MDFSISGNGKKIEYSVSMEEIIDIRPDGKPVRSKFLPIKRTIKRLPDDLDIKRIMSGVNIKRANYYKDPYIIEPLSYDEDEIQVLRYVCETSKFVSLADMNLSKYELSLDCRVRHVKTGYTTSGSMAKSGYKTFSLTFDDGIQRAIRPHRLMAYRFLGPPPTPKHTTVDHMDIDKENSYLYNLRWSTPEQQVLNRKICRKHAKRVLAYEYSTGILKMEFFSVKQASIYLGISRSSMANLCRNNKIWGIYVFGYDLADLIDFEGVPEEWRTVFYKDIGHIYVSSMGRVYTKMSGKWFGHKTATGRMIAAFKTSLGKVKCIQVHKLVMLAFYGESTDPQRSEIDHKNGNSSFNHYKNLRYVSSSENSFNSYITGNSVSQLNSPLCKPVVQLTIDWKFVNEFFSVSEAARMVGPGNEASAKAGIFRILGGKTRKTAFGYKWIYSETYFEDNPYHF